MSRAERRVALLFTLVGAVLLMGALASEERAAPAPVAGVLPVASPEVSGAAPAQPAPQAAPSATPQIVPSDPLATEPELPQEALETDVTWVRPTLFPAPQPELEDGALLTDLDLAPYFDDEPYRTAKAKFDAGRYPEAAALIPPRLAITAPERYLRALSLYRSREGSKAGAEFAALANDYEILADRCHYLAGLSFETAGDFRGAAAEYAKVDETSTLYRESRKCVARSLRSVGDLRSAIAALTPLARRPAPLYGYDYVADALFAVAEMEQVLRDKAAGPDFVTLWSEHPLSRYGGELALDRASKLKVVPTPEQTIVRGELLMEAHHNREAMNLLRPFDEAPPKTLSAEWVCRARFAIGKAMRKERLHAQAIATLKKVLEPAGRCEDPEVRAKALYIAGTSASIIDPEQGIAFYKQLAEEWPEHSFADDALFFAGDLQLRQGRPKEARASLLALAKLYPQGDYRAEGLFKVFWIDRLQGDHEAGLRVLERLEREYDGSPDPIDAERARYWKARTLLELKREGDALATFEKLALDHPATYYGMLARSRLSELSPEKGKAVLAELAKPVEEKPFAYPAKALLTSRHFAEGLELMRLGLRQEAIDELLNVERAPLRAQKEPYGLRALVVLLGRLGEARAAHAVARANLNRDLVGRSRPETAAVWKVAYPLAFRDILEEQTKLAGTDPDLLQALMREESALDPNIHSWAGAVGLCQLMVPTANEVARQLKMRRVSARDLHDPKLNILFGATYLKALVRRFEGSYALALASYNAGGGAVSGWVRNGRQRELDEFVEEIPIAETRNYVKRVLRSYSTYRLLYGDKYKLALVPQQKLGPTVVEAANGTHPL